MDTNRASDIQIRFVNERINRVEKHFADLCQDFSKYNRKLARTRDTADTLVRDIIRFADGERLNSTLQQGMLGFADCLAAVQDYRDAQVQRMDKRVVQSLSLYGTICKHAKEDLKGNSALWSREMNRRNQLDRARGRYPPNWQHISKAENELHKASTEALHSSKTFENHMDDFERRKVQDLKVILLDFINIHLLFHAKALELYTKAYHCIDAIDEEQDLEDFRNCLRMPPPMSRLNTIHSSMFRSTPNLPTLDDEAAAGSGRHSLRSSPRPQPRRSLTTAFGIKPKDSDRDLGEEDDDESDERPKSSVRPRRK